MSKRGIYDSNFNDESLRGKQSDLAPQQTNVPALIVATMVTIGVIALIFLI